MSLLKNIKFSDHLKLSILIPLIFTVINWTVMIVAAIFKISLGADWGILPRSIDHIQGIITSPLVHGDFAHLSSNTLPAFFMGVAILYFYRETGYKAALICYIAPGLLVWIFGRESYHIGASGVIYALAAFLFFSGVFKRDIRSIAISLLVVLFYGGMVYGVFPGAPNISWESHLLGAIAGAVTAFIFRKKDKIRKYDWEDEDEEADFNEYKSR